MSTALTSGLTGLTGRLKTIARLRRARNKAWEKLRRYRVGSSRGHFNDAANQHGDETCKALYMAYLNACTQLDKAWVRFIAAVAASQRVSQDHERAA